MKQLKAAINQVNDEESDVHNRLMRAYPDIPEWVFLAFLGVMVLAQIAVSLWTPFQMPIWSIFLCLTINLVFLLPFGVIQAIAAFPLGLNVLTEFVIGLLIPGKTVAVMAFKSLGTNTLHQSLVLLGDLKLGHYMKINPVHMVAAQLYGTVIGAIVNTSVSISAEDFLGSLLFKHPDWDATSYRVFYNAGAIWGAIGPQRFFGIGSVYQDLMWFFLAGFLLPFVPWLGNKLHPSRYWMYLNIPILASFPTMPGAIQSSVLVPLIVAWFFQHYVFHHHRDWWKRVRDFRTSDSIT